MQRAAGKLNAVFGFREHKSRLLHLYQAAPCRGLMPTVDAEEPPQLVLVNTGGGIVGGDRIDITVAVEAGASATISSVAAEKIYRAIDQPAQLRAILTLGPGSYTEWLPQETILFNAARLDRSLQISLAGDATLLATEIMVLGRQARGERLLSGSLRDGWRVDRDGKPVWIDCLRMAGDLRAARALPFGFGEAAGYATVLVAAPDAASLLPRIRDLLNAQTTQGAATLVNGLLLARFLEDDAARLRHSVGDLVSELRHMLRGLPRRLPRVWMI